MHIIKAKQKQCIVFKLFLSHFQTIIHILNIKQKQLTKLLYLSNAYLFNLFKTMNYLSIFRIKLHYFY